VLARDSMVLPHCCSGIAPAAASQPAVSEDGSPQEREGCKKSAKPGSATGKDKMPRGPKSSRAPDTSALIAIFLKALHC